jgi:penicillin V acylase-like amidase (Ntn superfamily)
MYEISTDIPAIKACSSIVAKNKDGNILHGRNLDFWPWGLFSKGTAIVEVYRGN